MDIIEQNIIRVKERIAAAAKRAGTPVDEISLVAVSKTVPIEKVQRALECGISIFGENYIQEGTLKAEQFQDRAAWHFIGHLQKNKVKFAVEYFDMIQSLDSVDLALKINDVCERFNRNIDVLLQIHYGVEETKHGFNPEEVFGAADKIRNCSRLRLKGLMTIPPLENDAESNRKFFADMRSVGEKIFGNDDHILSMGMTSDFEIAIEEGSNMVRIGTAIFGSRNNIIRNR